MLILLLSDVNNRMTFCAQFSFLDPGAGRPRCRRQKEAHARRHTSPILGSADPRASQKLPDSLAHGMRNEKKRLPPRRYVYNRGASVLRIEIPVKRDPNSARRRRGHRDGHPDSKTTAGKCASGPNLRLRNAGPRPGLLLRVECGLAGKPATSFASAWGNAPICRQGERGLLSYRTRSLSVPMCTSGSWRSISKRTVSSVAARMLAPSA